MGKQCWLGILSGCRLGIANIAILSIIHFSCDGQSSMWNSMCLYVVEIAMEGECLEVNHDIF